MSENIEFNKSFSGFKYLKSENLNTLLPLSKIKNNNTSIICEVPLFYKTSGDKFVYFLPTDFLKEININEIMSRGNKRINNSFEMNCIHNEKDGGKYIYFSFDTLKELRNSLENKESIFNKFKGMYEDYQLDITNGEKVLIVAFKNNEGHTLTSNSLHSLKDDFKDKKIIFSSHSKFEYFSAYKFNNRYYLINKDQSIDQNASFNLNKNEDFRLNYLVMPYTEKDWLMCVGINQKMTEIKDKMDSLFSNQHVQGKLDSPLNESANPLLLELLGTTNKLKM